MLANQDTAYGFDAVRRPVYQSDRRHPTISIIRICIKTSKLRLGGRAIGNFKKFCSDVLCSSRAAHFLIQTVSERPARPLTREHASGPPLWYGLARNVSELLAMVGVLQVSKLMHHQVFLNVLR